MTQLEDRQVVQSKLVIYWFSVVFHARHFTVCNLISMGRSVLRLANLKPATASIDPVEGHQYSQMLVAQRETEASSLCFDVTCPIYHKPV